MICPKYIILRSPTPQMAPPSTCNCVHFPRPRISASLSSLTSPPSLTRDSVYTRGLVWPECTWLPCLRAFAMLFLPPGMASQMILLSNSYEPYEYRRKYLCVWETLPSLFNRIRFFPPLKPRITLSSLPLSILTPLCCSNCITCLILPNKWQIPYYVFNPPVFSSVSNMTSKWLLN